MAPASIGEASVAAAAVRTVDHLCKTYGATVSVDDLSFGVDPGEIVGLLGPNGAGKTTTINMILGVLASAASEMFAPCRTFAKPARSAYDREPEMPSIDPAEDFAGRLLVLSPHMDDEVLACGGLLARLPDKHRIYVVYATDGMRSPAPVLPWRQSITPDLGERRMQESRRAVGLLGIPSDNLAFLGLPEARLPRHADELRRLLVKEIEARDPDHVLMPFRYDRHPDHLAINRAITLAQRQGRIRARLSEYFVYHRWRLLPLRDVRRYVRPQYLLEVDIEGVAAQKRAALSCFTTQTTRFYPWQTRAILTPELLDDECSQPEQFLRVDPAVRGAGVFSHAAPWIRVVHRVEPLLQKGRYLAKATVLGLLGGHGRDAA